MSTTTPANIEERVFRQNLQARKWIGFDLDDTLHEFRKASRAATTHGLTLIAQANLHVTLQDLQERYGDVIKQGRRARLISTLEHFSLGHGLVDNLLDEYERVLVQNLQLKNGAQSLLQSIKASGRKVVIITEGPQDAQERAVRDLGIAESIDFLATTNHFGVSKTSGLFGKVLQHLDIGTNEIAYAGDSWDCDIVPAKSEGVYAIHFNETQTESLNAGVPSINSLQVLQDLLSQQPLGTT